MKGTRETMEVYDNLIKSIRIMYKTKGLSLIKNNGIKTNGNNQIVTGRYADFSKADASSIKESIPVINEITGEETVRSFGEPVKVDEPKKVIQDEKEVQKETGQKESKTEKEETVIDPVETVHKEEVTEEIEPAKAAPKAKRSRNPRTTKK